MPVSSFCAMAKRLNRKLLRAWIVIHGSRRSRMLPPGFLTAGAKVVVQEGCRIPNRFELALFQAVDKRQNAK